MPRLTAAILIAGCCVAASELEAQCSDGSPPPCQVTRVATREPTRTPDPNRIAILPFRVTTTDTLLGEGFAELLATEFTGEGAPRAIDMATVLSAWRRAGGGLRTPLPRAKAMQVARDLGAGLVSEGSIVGLGRNITITATLFSATDGAPRGAPARVTTSSDSLESALRQAATSLLGAVGGQQRALEGARYTESPDAMRSYLQGLSAWRRGRVQEAATNFDKAIAADSSFAQAMFRRYLVGLWGFGTGPYTRLAWEHRARLAPQERTVLEGILGADYPRARTIDQRHADRERAANRLPDSPDALYLIGDYWYHYGAPIDPVNQLVQARDYFVRAVALDSQATVLRHLVEVGLRLRDTSLLRRVVPAYLRTEDGGTWAAAWISAASIGDAALLASVRRRDPGAHDGQGFWPMASVMIANIPGGALDELFTRWPSHIPPGQLNRFAALRGNVLVARGRPAAAERAWAGLPSDMVREADRIRIQLALAESAIGLDVVGSVRRLAALTATDTSVTPDACLVALWRVRQGDTTNFNFARYTQSSASCALGIDLIRMRPGSAVETPAFLAKADSIVRNNVNSGFEHFLVAKAWEALGDVNRALSAIRYRALGFGMGEAPWTLPYEGRLAAIVGDTVGAIHAYRYWLEINADAEPILTPKRDSVRAELARLTRKAQP